MTSRSTPMTTVTVSRSVASRRSQIGGATVHAVAALLVVVVTLACLSFRADATTTSASAYDDSRGIDESIDAASVAEARVEPTRPLSPSHGYDDAVNLARTSPRLHAYRSAPQTTLDPNCSASVVIGESSRRTGAAALAFGATWWQGTPPGTPHVETCAANEAWISAQIQRGAHIIDVGIDGGRQGSRSPYYALELRKIAEAGYPVERRPWPASPGAYTPPDPGPCP